MFKSTIKKVVRFAKIILLSVFTGMILSILVKLDIINLGAWEAGFISSVIVWSTVMYMDYLSKNNTI